MKQNLDFPRLMLAFPDLSNTELHLPKIMRLNCYLRMFRFVFYLATILCGVLIFNYRNDKKAYDLCENREKCILYHMEDIYPELFNRANKLQIIVNYHNNIYTDFYLYEERDTYGFRECYGISQEVTWTNR